MSISEHIVRVTRAGREATAIDFRGRTVAWAALGAAIAKLDALLRALQLDPSASVGLLGRNRLEPLVAFITVIGGGRGLLLVNAMRPQALVAQEIRELRLACLLGGPDDLTPEVLAAACEVGTLAVEVGYNGRQILSVDTDISISENPNFRFYFLPKQDGALTVDAIDSTDLSFKTTLQVKTN